MDSGYHRPASPSCESLCRTPLSTAGFRTKSFQRRLRVVVRRYRHERRPDGPHPRPVPCLSKLLEDCGRGVFFGHRPRRLEPLGEGFGVGLVALSMPPVQFEHLFGDEVGQGGDNALSPRAKPPPEVVLCTEEHTLTALEYGLGVAFLPAGVLDTPDGELFNDLIRNRHGVLGDVVDDGRMARRSERELVEAHHPL